MIRILTFVVFTFICSLTASGQVVNVYDYPVSVKQDTTSVFSGKYAINLSRVSYAMDWINRECEVSNETEYVSGLRGIYKELESFKLTKVNYALIDKKLAQINERIKQLYIDFREINYTYKLIRKEILAKTPDKVDQFILDGMKLRDESKFIDSYNCFKKAFESDSTRLYTYFLLINDELFLSQDTLKALYYLNKLIKLNNGEDILTFNPLIQRANINFSQCKYDLAIQDLNILLAKKPDDEEVYFNRAYTKSYQKDYEGSNADYYYLLNYAKSNLKKTTRIDSALVTNNIAWNHYLMNDYEKCVLLANKSLLIKPNYTAALDTRGSAYFKLGEFDKCIDDMTNIIKLNSQEGNAWYFRGLAYLKQNKTHLACTDLSKAYCLGVADAAVAMKGVCGVPSSFDEELHKQFTRNLKKIKTRIIFRVDNFIFEL
jgi:Flp pilus assembly protein TadD